MTLSRRSLRLAPAAALVLTLIAAPLSSSAKHGAAVVTDGEYQCYKGYIFLGFDFVGRMPAGSSFYQVTEGHAASNGLSCVDSGLSMTGATASGTFKWLCTGRLTELFGGVYVTNEIHLPLFPTYAYNGTCVTIGRPGYFNFQAGLEATEDLGSSAYGPHYRLKGVIHTGLPPAG